ncbi:MAG: sporulation transcriptional regulator SpoIIID [Eubacteriales bacterium]|nr:sporulation transcriptional regulator SpoIIID [Eubacteriales bacterium]
MSVSDWSGRARCVVLGEYLAQNRTTVRQAAAVFGVSKSTVHKDVTETLRFVNQPLWRQVQDVLQQNKEERHLRGGEATRIKYSALHAKREHQS